jgi:hypothetical protein
MRTVLKSCVYFAVIMLLSGLRAEASVVIDFQSLTTNIALFVQIGSVYTNQGFVPANSDPSGPTPLRIVGTPTYLYPGSTTLITAEPNPNPPTSYWTDTRITAINGQPFDLHSIDITFVDKLVATPVTFVGSLAGGGSVSTNITLPAWLNLNAHPSLFTKTLIGFSSLTSVDIIANPYPIQIDNIVLSPVPEPNTSLLVGFGVAICVGIYKLLAGIGRNR